MEDVKHSEDGPALWDVSCVISCWCGGAFDTKRNQLVVWGGGHGQYSGNELYGFDVDLLKWERYNDPSNPPARDVPYASDGNPCSRHTYNYLQYLPSTDHFYTFGGAAFYYSGGTGTNKVDRFDYDSKAWDTDISQVPSGGTGYSFSAVDAKTGFAWTHGGYSSGRLCMYNPYTNAWALRGSGYMGSGFTVTADIDPLARKMVIVGDGKVFTYDVDAAGTLKISELSTSGATSIQSGYAVGLAYDPVSESMIAWNSGSDIFALDVSTGVWTKHTTSNANPGANSGNGTYGRFRYCPDKNVFVVVNASNRNVFIYKHTSAAGAPQWYLDMLSDQSSAVQGHSTRLAGSALEVEVMPNPFNLAVKIIVRRYAYSVRSISLQIYDISGKLVKDFTPYASRITPYTVTWNAFHLPPGIYILKVKTKTRSISKKLFLIQ
jgi:hypothetical protein